jgi:VWFA-related protein
MFMRVGGLAWVTMAAALLPAGEPERPPAFGADTARVAVDLVVRGKDGGILRGLRTDEVEVYEDGVRQDLESLEFVERTRDLEASASSSQAVTPPPILAVVLDTLSPEGRRAAHDAVLLHLREPLRSPPLVGIFSVDRGLRQLQAFTDNPETLGRALGRLLSRGSSSYSGLREREDIRHAHAGLSDGSPQASVAPAELSGEPECRLGGDDLVRRLKVLSSRMKESFDTLERDQRGAATANALLALVDGLAPHPGRKAVLLFSEGLAIPSGVEASFRSVMAAANRGNVSVYAVDAAGLRARSAADETRRSIETLRTRLELVQAAPPGTRGPGAAEMGESGLSLLEQNEDTLRLAPESGLGQLARETGGFLLHGTNDLAAGLEQIDEDLGQYYLVSYTPKKAEYDGRFRTIEVKVRRPHGRLQARRGYLAVPAALPSPVLDHEARALARLDGGVLPSAVPVRLRALQFPKDPEASLVPIVVEVSAGGFAAALDPEARVRRRDFTVLALVRNQEGRVVAKSSQRYALAAARRRGPAEESVLFYREARLAPGRYTVEVVAQDAASEQAGGARAALEVRLPPAGHLRASSLVLVGRAERLQEGDEAAPAPLRYQDVLLYPHLGGALRPEVEKSVVLFLTAWPSAERPGIDARVEVLHEGKTLLEVPAGRHEAGPDGRVQLASSLPLGGFGPGAYELRVILSDGRDAETRSTALRVAR